MVGWSNIGVKSVKTTGLKLTTYGLTYGPCVQCVDNLNVCVPSQRLIVFGQCGHKKIKQG